MSPAAKRGSRAGGGPARSGGGPGRSAGGSGRSGGGARATGPARSGTGARSGAPSRSTAAPGARGAARPGGRGGANAAPKSPAAAKAVAARTEKQRAKSDAGRRAAAAKAPARPGRSAGTKAERGAAKDRGLGGEQVEGRQAVRELLVAGRRRVKEIWVATREADDPRFDEHVDDLADLAQSMGVAVREVSRRKLLDEARTESPQGVLAKAAPLPELELDALTEGRDPRGRPPFLIAVDGVTDPGNLGALLRSAECAGVTGVILPRHRAVHVTPTVAKASAGAIEYLPMAVVGGLPTAILELQRRGVWVIGLDMDGTPIHEATLPADAGVCLVMGAEGKGLSRLVRQRCDAVVSLPLRGTLASLNVAAAGAVACYEVARRRP